MPIKNRAVYGMIVLATVLLVGAGCNSKPEDRYGKQMMEHDQMKKDAMQTPSTKESGTMMDDQDMGMMDDSHMKGIVKKEGRMMTEWEGGEMMKMDHDVLLKDGTKIMMDGSVIKKDGSRTMMKEGEKMTVNDLMMKTEEVKKDMMMNEVKGSYQPYSAEKIALAEKEKVVLFFHASWCPTCRALEEDILRSSVPDGVTILKVDYDSATELKKKYGVTVQHTFVQVDKNGNLIKKWSGASTLNEVIKQIQ